jgi:hypothetical protein
MGILTGLAVNEDAAGGFMPGVVTLKQDNNVAAVDAEPAGDGPNQEQPPAPEAGTPATK